VLVALALLVHVAQYDLVLVRRPVADRVRRWFLQL
jgi:hypothetical protein